MNQKQSASKAERNSESQMDERSREIAQAAYYKAEHRGFAPGHEVEDWLEAEREIEAGALSVD